ncbi:unnamed protein product [Arctia plantaginis]|uniref:MADF domain-containing protein n=1 Tax=Arctia plantaginis TaxID=874455 RepID=A0A8S1A341_ARCPL|nr:unnamed protein product [Arctia plantaginis]
MFHEKLDVKLIRQVKENPVLYDYTHEKYMDFNAREVAWQKIGDELKRPAADCKVRWINIRDVHRRILRKSLVNSSRPCKSYKYDSELVFMRQHYKDVSAPSASCDDEEKGDDWSAMVCDNDGTGIQNDSCSDDSEKPIKKIKTKRKKAKKRKELLYEEEEKQATSTFNEAPTISGEFDTTDPVDAFLLSIGATLKTFSPYHLNVAKSKIFAVVQEHDLQQIVQKDRHEQTDVKTSVSGGMYIV